MCIRDSSYSEFVLRAMIAKANSPMGFTSDMNPGSFKQTNWGQAFLGGGVGDISFGAAENGGPTTSYARYVPQAFSCLNCEFPFPGPVDAIFNVGRASTTFRIEWGEHGGEHEGWYPWWAGDLYVR